MKVSRPRLISNVIAYNVGISACEKAVEPERALELLLAVALFYLMFVEEGVVVPPLLHQILKVLVVVTLIFHRLEKLRLTGCPSLEGPFVVCAEK